jgi:hypothetical protein
LVDERKTLIEKEITSTAGSFTDYEHDEESFEALIAPKQ